MEYEEFTGKTVEDAITEACTKFTVTSDRLDYEIIEKGSSGFLGIGTKAAVIKARALGENEERPVREVKESKEESAEKNDKSESVKAKEGNASEIVLNNDPKEFLDKVFSAMGLKVDVKVELINNDMNIELSGDEMGVLIGKRGQTLDSLQYLTSLVVNKGSSEYIRVKVDTENYRKRRKDTLENLAKNLAYKVKRTKRPVSLEPMNPYERRVIHSALQNDKYVSTHSEGDEPFRRVVITLNK
ncbi:MAG: protein jag [Lachnospiraceae bacterium]|nr:protein jag [Lachnospiraceae bacterium]